MTPEEKADELIEKFGNKLWSDDDEQTAAKACAIICVDEIIDDLEDMKVYSDDNETASYSARVIYWQQVKTFLQSK